MVTLKRFVWVGVIAAGGGLAHAQTTGGNTGGTTGGGGGTASPESTIQITQVETPTITSTTANGGGTQSSAVSTSNGLARYYNNPMWQGRAGTNTGSQTTVVAPGGFGQALYGTTGVSGAAGAGGTGGGRGTGANTGATGATATRTGGATGATALGGATGGRAGGLGTTTGLGSTTGFGATGRAGGAAGGFGGTNTQASQQNAALSTGRQIAYTQTLKFAAAPPVAPVQLQTDLQSMIATSSALSNNAGVQVSAGDGGVIVIRGRAADDDEVRLIENMIRLTPGVKDVKNELTTK